MRLGTMSNIHHIGNPAVPVNRLCPAHPCPTDGKESKYHVTLLVPLSAGEYARLAKLAWHQGCPVDVLVSRLAVEVLETLP